MTSRARRCTAHDASAPGRQSRRLIQRASSAVGRRGRMCFCPGGPLSVRRTTRLKSLIAAPEIVVMPGVHDALGARLAEAAGFSALMAGGYGATAALLGRPDSSQLSL